MDSDTGSPIISVIIPALNEEKLISKTLSQFTPDIKKKFNLELIVSDGGSKDKTISIAKDYADKIISPDPCKKQNISIGRNTGAASAKGTFLYFFNADTKINDIDNFFSKTLRAFDDKNVIAVTCNIRIFPEEKKLSDVMFHTFYNNYVFILNKIGMGMGRGECHIIRKDFFQKTGGYNEDMAAGEDYDLYRRLKRFGKIKFLRELTVYESPRRYRRFSYFGVFVDWTKNSISVLFRGKAISKTWEEVR